MTIYKRGDVVSVRYPNSDMKTWKPRPALVVQANDIDTGISQTLLALITSNQERKGETRVFVLKDSKLGRDMGLWLDSVVVTDCLQTVKNYVIDKKIGHCSQMEAIDIALKKTLGV